MMTRIRSLFQASIDPTTGDHLTAGEHVSWMLQRVMRRWAFLGGITLATAACWLLGDTERTWWNYAASYMALVVEGITAMALINQTVRDALVTRTILKMEREHGELLRRLVERQDVSEAAVADRADNADNEQEGS